MLDPRDRAMLDNLTKAVDGLTKAIYTTAQPDTFHNRQVPALQRQQKVVEFIREKRQMYVDSPNPIVTNQVVLNLLDKVGNMLIKS